MRQVVLDTETTGLDPASGHRIIEIGCVEIINRRVTDNTYHQYLQPDREIDAGAVEVHGITNDFLADKPRFPDVVNEFVEFIQGAELVIHNAPFDTGFINHELKRLGAGYGGVMDHCQVLDTLAMARRLHPGQKNNLDALCKRYGIDNSQRDLHGALLDAEILADVYLAMTGGQVNLSLEGERNIDTAAVPQVRHLASGRQALRVIRATGSEVEAHTRRLDAIDKSCGKTSIWRRLEEGG